MKALLVAVAVVIDLGAPGIAAADSAYTLPPKGVYKPAPPPGPPDEIADVESSEANLESNAPRSGLTFAGAVGFGVMVGDGIGRGGAISLRMGHVATRKSVITFELTINARLHKESTMGGTLTDSNAGLMAGVQRYAGGSTWFRLAGGIGGFTKNIGGDREDAAGIATVVGGGFDLFRWGYLVLGLEAFALSSITSDGFNFSLGFCTGLSYY